MSDDGRSFEELG